MGEAPRAGKQLDRGAKTKTQPPTKSFAAAAGARSTPVGLSPWPPKWPTIKVGDMLCLSQLANCYCSWLECRSFWHRTTQRKSRRHGACAIGRIRPLVILCVVVPAPNCNYAKAGRRLSPYARRHWGHSFPVNTQYKQARTGR